MNAWNKVAPPAAGQLLLRLGNPEELEVVAEVLTQDALHLSTGAQVHFHRRWPDQTLDSKVKQWSPPV